MLRALIAAHRPTGAVFARRLRTFKQPEAFWVERPQGILGVTPWVRCEWSGPDGNCARVASIHPIQSTGIAVRRLTHNLRDSTVESGNPGGGYAAVEELAAMYVQGGEIGPGATALVFSLVLSTNSPGSKGLPWQRLACRSRARPTLASKCGLRGRNQQRCCQGRMASSCSQRQMVVPLLGATMPLRHTLRAASAQDLGIWQRIPACARLQNAARLGIQ